MDRTDLFSKINTFDKKSINISSIQSILDRTAQVLAESLNQTYVRYTFMTKKIKVFLFRQGQVRKQIRMTI